jgi:hypothetical protein
LGIGRPQIGTEEAMHGINALKNRSQPAGPHNFSISELQSTATMRTEHKLRGDKIARVKIVW